MTLRGASARASKTYHQGRHVHQRHVRSDAGAAIGAQPRSNYVKFDQTTVATLSPIRHLDRLHAPVIVAYGTCETPEFQRQNREFAAAVENAGKKVQLLVAEHHNHFELPETLGNPYGLLGRAALDLMGLIAGAW
jgi:arylformamidase